MRVYISGPISTEVLGTDREERKARFHKAEEWIKHRRPEWTPVNPLLVAACDGDPMQNIRCEPSMDDIFVHDWECWLRYDLQAMLTCGAIYLLPHWLDSKGARLEAHVAIELGMKMYFADEDGRIK